MFKMMPTIDGQESWVMNVNECALEKAKHSLAELRQHLNDIDYNRGGTQKTFVTGLTCGIEAYLEIISRGKAVVSHG